ncbi:hypothetical protein GFK26_16110 [Variovorax paradoxus]|uniref:Uncharacterized protein n=1 Tax=Variovorax paradoxus TaxID=34073 RepID=A0A5Q0M6U5_VARPD|nr:hypothetical protein [Variovorax paradoxus]QFZ84172.1 hypothetical protein GFK26_16110 [Variovorax paradoxus]
MRKDSIVKRTLQRPSLRSSVKPEPWWLVAAKAHPFKTLTTAVLLTGGFMTLLFLVSIKHLPELDWASSSTLLAAVAVIGIAIVLFIGGGGVAPAIISMSIENKGAVSGMAIRNMLLCGIPAVFLLILFFVHPLVPLSSQLPTIDQSWILSATLLSMALLAFAIGCSVEGKSRKPATSRASVWMRRADLSFSYFFVQVIWAMMLMTIVVTLALMRQGSEPDNDTRFFQALVVWLGVLALVNALVLRSNTLHAAVRGAFAGMLTMLIALVMQGNLTGLALTAFKALGLANIPARLVLTAHGCELLNAAVRGGPVCTSLPDQKIAVVCPAILKSRLGSPYLIELAPMDAEGHWPAVDGRQTIPIPRKEVLSWPRIGADQSQKVLAGGALTRPSTILTSLNKSNQMEQLWLDEHCNDLPSTKSGPEHE